jgi:NAD(P)H-hydrate epimerase
MDTSRPSTTPNRARTSCIRYASFPRQIHITIVETV